MLSDQWVYSEFRRVQDVCMLRTKMQEIWKKTTQCWWKITEDFGEWQNETCTETFFEEEKVTVRELLLTCAEIYFSFIKRFSNILFQQKRIQTILGAVFGIKDYLQSNHTWRHFSAVCGRIIWCLHLSMHKDVQGQSLSFSLCYKSSPKIVIISNDHNKILFLVWAFAVKLSQTF